VEAEAGRLVDLLAPEAADRDVCFEAAVP